MTVRELRQALFNLDQDLPVYAANSRNGEVDSVNAAFQSDNQGYEAGDILLETSPRFCCLSI